MATSFQVPASTHITSSESKENELRNTWPHSQARAGKAHGKEMVKALKQLEPQKFKTHEAMASKQPFQKGLNKPPLEWDPPS